MTAAKGFQAAGMYGGLRAAGRKPDLALVVCETDAVSAGKNSPKIVVLPDSKRETKSCSGYLFLSFIILCF